jgi:hypothetical protein
MSSGFSTDKRPMSVVRGQLSVAKEHVIGSFAQRLSQTHFLHNDYQWCTEMGKHLRTTDNGQRTTDN